MSASRSDVQGMVPERTGLSASSERASVERFPKAGVGTAFHASDRYFVLDGLRGVAALAVLIFHHRSWYFGEHVLAHSYIAVDFFFMLSGLLHRNSVELATK